MADTWKKYYTAKLQNNSPQNRLELWQFCRVWELIVGPCLAPVYNRFFYKLSSHSWKYNIKFSALCFLIIMADSM